MISRTTVLVVLGSFPGAASLAAQQYYGHPQNHFWRIMEAIFSVKTPESQHQMALDSYQNRSKWLLTQGVGLWDVYASCERQGSLDSAIRNPQVNDFAWLKAQCPQLKAIAHNGGESFRHAEATAGLGLAVHKLPSTSPANASWSFCAKLAAWREVMVLHGLVPS